MLIPVTFGQAQYRPGGGNIGGNNAGGAASDVGGMVIDINKSLLGSGDVWTIIHLPPLL